MNTLVFDIQTIPDIDGARRLYDLHGLSEQDVAKAIFHKRRQQANTEVLHHHLQKIVAISAVLVNRDNFKLWSLGDAASSEQDLLQRFYAGLERYTPRLVSWNGRCFNLPVIQYRSLLYPVNAQAYWDNGELDSHSHNYNSLSRGHHRHTDMLDVLSAKQSSAVITLDEIATLCGFPGHMAKQNSNAWINWLAGDIKIIRDSCETTVLNTYLVYLNWERNCGIFDTVQYQQHCDRIRTELKTSEKAHLIEFEKSWIDL